MGYNKTHLRLMIFLCLMRCLFTKVCCLWSGLSLRGFEKRSPLDILYTIDEKQPNAQQEREEVQLNIVDIHIAGEE